MPAGERTTEDRVLGCILGGALGDAWGGPWEGRSGPQQFAVPERSCVSDDTQLTLATCESIVLHRRVDPEGVASQFAEYFVQQRIPGIGSSTLKAMRDLTHGVHWALAGSTGEYAAGNGAAMRIAPLAFLLDPSSGTDRKLIRDVCRITHHHDEAYLGALAVVIAIRSVLAGSWSRRHSFLDIVSESLPDCAVRDRVQALIESSLPPAEAAARFGSGGYVVDTVPLALLCAQSIVDNSLPTVLARTIGIGGDTDTIASITGQIAGTAVGAERIVTDLFDAVENSEELFGIAQAFARFVSNGSTGAATFPSQ